MEGLMASIFHYTDAVGLKGILLSETLFATDYRFLNDTSEVGIIRDLVLPVLEAEIAEITPKLVKKSLLKGFYEFHGMSGHRLQAEGFFRTLLRLINDISPLFVLSFCKHDVGSKEFEHGLLSQWRGYGEAGGFAVEFDEAGMDELLKVEIEKFAYVGFKADDVLYDKYERLFVPDDFKGLAGEMIRRIFEPRDVSEVTGRKDIDAFMPKFMSVAPFMKHWGFREEREYRVLFSCIRSDKIPATETRPSKEIKFRIKNGQIVSYIEVFDYGPSFPIKSIIVGPHASQELQCEAVKLMLKTEGIDATIRVSEIPYRR
jgi:hypothetical protein